MIWKNKLPDDGKEKKPSCSSHIFTRLFYLGGFDFSEPPFLFVNLSQTCDDPDTVN